MSGDHQLVIMDVPHPRLVCLYYLILENIMSYHLLFPRASLVKDRQGVSVRVQMHSHTAYLTII